MLDVLSEEALHQIVYWNKFQQLRCSAVWTEILRQGALYHFMSYGKLTVYTHISNGGTEPHSHRASQPRSWRNFVRGNDDQAASIIRSPMYKKLAACSLELNKLTAHSACAGENPCYSRKRLQRVRTNQFITHSVRRAAVLNPNINKTCYIYKI